MTIVILGYRAGLVDAAREVDDVLVIADHDKPGLDQVSHTLVRDIGDLKDVRRGLQNSGAARINAVVTAHEQGVHSCHALRRELHLPRAAEEDIVVRFRNKHKQKVVLGPDVPHANHLLVDLTRVNFRSIAASLGCPFVLKPVDGFGSIETRVITSEFEYGLYLRDLDPGARTLRVAETFVHGDEWHVDGIWVDGSFTWAEVTAYTHPPIRWLDGIPIGGAPLAGMYPELEAKAVDLAVTALRQLQAPDAVVHVEMFCKPDGALIFSEAAIRVAGGSIPDVLELTFGTNLYRAEIELALGRTMAVPKRSPRGAVFGYTNLLRTSRSRCTEASLKHEFALIECEYPNATDGSIGAYGRWGNAIVRGADHTEVLQLLHEVACAAEGIDGTE